MIDLLDMQKPLVHIVHHIDTEGPLYESLPELFYRIEEAIGKPLNMYPTKGNLKLIQSADFTLGNPESDDLLKRLVDPHLLNFKSSWYEIDDMLDRILSSNFRNQYKDSFGNAWVYNWHLLDHVGFTTNPRRREMGYSGVFNFYKEKLRITGSENDSLQWHFHPVPFNKAANICATSYLNSAHELTQIVCRRLIDYNWFPVVNRAGFHTIRPDSNWWLEQWLPFDASNQATDTHKDAFKDTLNGRFGDWRGAPDNWSLYNPDLYDWRKKGNLKRTISRCLNMNTRFRNINVKEFKKAFDLAKKTNANIYIGLTNHDFRDMAKEIDDVYNMLLEAKNEFPDIDYKFSDTISAFRACLGFSNNEASANKVEVKAVIYENILKVSITNGEIFGSQPFLAIKTKEGSYYSDNFDFGEPGSVEFYYTFDYMTLDLSTVQTIAVAANDKYGNTSIAKLQLTA